MAENPFLAQIRANALFLSVDEALLGGILGKLREVSVPDGELIFEDGNPGGCMYLVLAGMVTITKMLASGEDVVLGVIQRGEFFGELDVIDNRHRSAQAVATGACTLAQLDIKEFTLLVTESPQFMQNLLQTLSLRLRNANLTYVQHEESNLEALHSQLDRTHKLIEASKIVNSSIDLDRLLELILLAATQTVEADRGTLYLLDHAKKEIWSKVLQGSSLIEIRLPVGTGIAGTVAITGETISIEDAYSDPRFNPEIDRLTGYRTKSTLCMPLKNKAGVIVGVLQLLNKLQGPFTTDDEEFIEGLSAHASIAVENAQLAQRMVQVERLSAVGRMASGIIHDIKNPMGVIRLSAQLIKSRSTDKETGKLADDMVQQIDRFMNMTQEILEFARGESSTNIRTVNFGEMTNIIFGIIEDELGKRNVKLNRNLAFSGTINADPDKLLRAFYNLSTNAAEAMPAGGKLSVIAFQQNSTLVIEFVDTGCGIPPELQGKIFEPFFSYGKKHGTGLGMAIVKKIVEDHNGRIAITSEVGKGTTVRISLPL